MEQTEKEVISIMNDLSHGMLTNTLGAWTEQQSDSSEAEEGSKPTGDTDDSSSAPLRNAEEVVGKGPPSPPEGQCVQNVVEATERGRLALCLRTKVWWPMIFGELSHLCILYRTRLCLREC